MATKAPEADQYPAAGADELLLAGTQPANFEPEKIGVPEIQVSVYVRRVSAAELDEYALRVGDAEDADTRATILSHAMGDQHGRRLFVTPEQVEALKSWNGAAAQRVIRHFQKVNGLTPGDAAKK